MPVFGVSFSFDDNVGVIFKEGNMREPFHLEYTPTGLIDYFTEPGQLTSRKGVSEVMALV